MISTVLKKIFGTKQERDLKRLQPVVERINRLEHDVSKLSDSQLKDKTPEFKERLRKGETLDDILEEAFSVVREVAKRTINMRHFDVQIMGGVVLHQGKIAEMKTGEGKTLVATLPLYLNALSGKGVHLVTVNDYLAKRDRYWMGPIYEFLGLTVGLIQHDMGTSERQIAYQADITYGTNNEFGFDYLRDNMVQDKRLKVQRGHNFAIVDEVDSILIDEARTPLIISGPVDESTSKYYKADRIVHRLKKDRDYQVDEKARTCALTEEGVKRVEGLLGVGNLFKPHNMDWVHHINQALKAYNLFKLDVDYVVKEGQVVIVDEFTGRLMPGRRYSEGLHQALEAKEGVKIASESQTLATITFQNYFRMYKKLAGMTGTADTEAEEFDKIYGLDVVVIPTNKPMIRNDFEDVIYRTEREKFEAVVSEIEELYRVGRPCLVGTLSVEKSERLSKMLRKKGIPHQVLNAKHHEKEAQIVARAGQKKAVTIATNMAGRGTDIVLGDGVRDLGGLHIIGTERHEARRIDNQLRGRSGRQGDPGSSRFYLSLEDDLLRIFGGDRLKGLADRLNIEKGKPIVEHPWITRSIERAQKQVEAYNFDIRKNLLEYDDVMNTQREIIYKERDLILKEEDLKGRIQEMIEDVVDNLVTTYVNSSEEPDLESLERRVAQLFGFNLRVDQNDLKGSIISEINRVYTIREKEMGEENIRQLERLIMLQVLDKSWKDHLYAMDSLKEGIGLRAYGQRDPLVEYKHEAFSMFEALITRIKEEVVEYIFKVRLVEDRKHERHSPREIEGPMKKKIGRNAPCPCGSGRKYKYCCLNK
ncbi:MAG: preprotein translocase subunit SecA [bacterium]|nr:preprotein translocase subunit SecA [bacterium]